VLDLHQELVGSPEMAKIMAQGSHQQSILLNLARPFALSMGSIGMSG
jgi:hypothetical protein